MPATDFLAVIHALSEHCVDFIVVGGVAAVLEGAPISTFDLDIVHSRAIDNVQRFEGARRIRPQESHLASAGYQLLMTRFGPLDVLGAIGRSRGYEELLEHVTELQVEPGHMIRVLKLSKLIEVKSETAAEKDFATLPILRKTLEEKGPR
jgi:hypothetical protein